MSNPLRARLRAALLLLLGLAPGAARATPNFPEALQRELSDLREDRDFFRDLYAESAGRPRLKS